MGALEQEVHWEITLFGATALVVDALQYLFQHAQEQFNFMITSIL